MFQLDTNKQDNGRNVKDLRVGRRKSDEGQTTETTLSRQEKKKVNKERQPNSPWCSLTPTNLLNALCRLQCFY